MATTNAELRGRQKFWLIVAALLFLILLPFLLRDRPQCLETKTETIMETYYDFSPSGMGVWQQPETRTKCIRWEEVK